MITGNVGQGASEFKEIRDAWPEGAAANDVSAGHA